MPTLLNCLDEEQVLKAGGNHFTFKAGQLKFFHDASMCSLVASLHSSEGIVKCPDSLDEIAILRPEMADKIITKEQKEEILRLKKEGVDNYCRKLREQVYNATVSLQRDLDKAGFKYDARVEATKGDLHAMRQLNKYQKSQQDQSQNLVDEFKELEKQATQK